MEQKITTEYLLSIGFEIGNDNGYTCDFYKGGLIIESGVNDNFTDYFIEDKTGVELFIISDLDRFLKV